MPNLWIPSTLILTIKYISYGIHKHCKNFDTAIYGDLVQTWTNLVKILRRPLGVIILIMYQILKYHIFTQLLNNFFFKFWYTLLWGLGPNMFRLLSFFVYFFKSIICDQIPNSSHISLILSVLLSFLSKFWYTLLWRLGLNMARLFQISAGKFFWVNKNFCSKFHAIICIIARCTIGW